MSEKRIDPEEIRKQFELPEKLQAPKNMVISSGTLYPRPNWYYRLISERLEEFNAEQMKNSFFYPLTKEQRNEQQ